MNASYQMIHVLQVNLMNLLVGVNSVVRMFTQDISMFVT